MKNKFNSSVCSKLILLTFFLFVKTAPAQSTRNQYFKSGLQEWMLTSLDVTAFNNGDPIPQAQTEEEWKKAAKEGTPAWCFREGEEKYGRLYNWYAVNDPRGICPKGWHIPTKTDWSTLLNDEVDPSFSGNLKEGIRYSDGKYRSVEKRAAMWSSTEKSFHEAGDGSPGAWYAALNYQAGTSVQGILRGIDKGAGLAVKCVRRGLYDGFDITPGDIPNEGIMFVNHQKNQRSGHYGQVLVECSNGDLLAFYTNVSGKIYKGHSVAGWTEYKRSTDGGKTWGEPVIFAYSKKVWEENKVVGDTIPKGESYLGAYVVAVTVAPNRDLVAVLTRRIGTQTGTLGYKPPVYSISKDNGRTWSEPREVDPSRDVDEIAVTHNNSAWLVKDGVIYGIFVGGNSGGGKYSLYVSEDNGQTFKRRSEGLFEDRWYPTNFYYMTAKFLEDGRLIVYSYNQDDEFNLPYVTSSDNGHTWSTIKSSHMSKRLRNGQLSEKIGDYYFMHGRTGNHGDSPWNFVLYVSKDGINWDAGRLLNNTEGGVEDSYSANVTIGKFGKTKPKELLIQADIQYSASRVNIKHWRITNIKGAR